MAITRHKARSYGMDMTPMIDCIFQLLIFFMLSSSLLSPQIRLKLPGAATQDPAKNPEIVVSVTQEGQFHVNGERVESSQLVQKLRPLIEASAEKSVTIRGDEKMPYELFVQALDAARTSGAVHVNIMHR